MNEYFYTRSGEPGESKENINEPMPALHHRIFKQAVILRISKQLLFENKRLWEQINNRRHVLIIFFYV